MNRYNPYQGPYEGLQSRRGGPPNGFGPDRSHRFTERGRGRGFGRGRGGGGGGGGRGSSYSGHEGSFSPYDQGPPQGDMGVYNDYNSSPGQDTFYQSSNFGSGGPGQFGQDYGDLEDESGGYDQGGFGGRPPKRFQRQRDDKVHDSIIEDRIQRERPCRTLFIRNIKYETSSDYVRGLFEEHGEIKTFFDLIAHRGMVFVTYHDLRAAERARDKLQGSEISGRPIDVHYSLPRDDGARGAEKDKQQQLQGTLIVTLRNSASGQPIDDNEVRRKFQQFGDVKSVRPVGDRTDQRFVEFYDTRACDEAHDRLRHQGLQDGVMDIVLAAQEEDPRGASPRREDRSLDRGRGWDGPPSRGRRGGRGGRGRSRGGYGGDEWDHRGDWGRDRDRGRPYEEEHSGGRGRGGGFNSRFDNRGPGDSFDGPGPGPSDPPPYASGLTALYPQAPPTAVPVDARLEKAKKVQQLLEALKQSGASGVGGNPPPTAAPPPPSMPPMPPQVPPPGNPYYSSQPMPPFPPNSAPTSIASAYPGVHQQSSNSQPPPPPALAGMTPNLLALLQQNTQTQQRLPQQQQAPPQPPMPYNMPPQQMMSPPPPAPGMPQMLPNSQPSYQQLMAYLQGQKPGQ